MCQSRETTHTHFTNPVIVCLDGARYWLAPGECTTNHITEAVVYEANDPYLADRDVFGTGGLTVIKLAFLEGAAIANNKRPTVADMVKVIVSPYPIGEYAVNANGSLGRIVEVGSLFYQGYTRQGGTWSGGIGSAVIVANADFSW